MKSKLKEHFGFGISITEPHDEMDAVTFNCCFKCYFNNVIVLQSTKEWCSWLGKIRIIETASMLIKSDVLAVTPDGSLYPSSADMSPTAVIYLPDTLRFSYGQWMWEACRNKQHLLSKSQCSVWKHGLCSLYCSLTVFFSYSTVHDIATTFGSRFLVTTWSQILQLAPTNRCRNLSAVLQLPRVASSSSLLLMMLTKT